jgi:hypothetical protein
MDEHRPPCSCLLVGEWYACGFEESIVVRRFEPGACGLMKIEKALPFLREPFEFDGSVPV